MGSSSDSTVWTDAAFVPAVVPPPRLLLAFGGLLAVFLPPAAEVAVGAFAVWQWALATGGAPFAFSVCVLRSFCGGGGGGFVVVSSGKDAAILTGDSVRPGNMPLSSSDSRLCKDARLVGLAGRSDVTERYEDVSPVPVARNRTRIGSRVLVAATPSEGSSPSSSIFTPSIGETRRPTFFCWRSTRFPQSRMRWSWRKWGGGILAAGGPGSSSLSVATDS